MQERLIEEIKQILYDELGNILTEEVIKQILNQLSNYEKSDK